MEGTSSNHRNVGSSLLEPETQELRKALEYAVLQVILAEDTRAGMRTTSGAIRAMSELVWQYVQHAMVPDLEAFSNHARRTAASGKVDIDDVALLLRKLPDQLTRFRASFPSDLDMKPKSRPTSSTTNVTDNGRPSSGSASSGYRRSAEALAAMLDSSSSEDESPTHQATRLDVTRKRSHSTLEAPTSPSESETSRQSPLLDRTNVAASTNRRTNLNDTTKNTTKSPPKTRIANILARLDYDSDDDDDGDDEWPPKRQEVKDSESNHGLVDSQSP
eukprot:Nitzschia sp. Nitz4//scaffold67_size101165//97114//97938//NITZ4_004547-RA/size101165-processed-gene-0.52-mRNA-1//1//CDS//3329556528//2152//frame0